MRRAVSVQSLSGESRTFAELPDLEVERVVLHYLRIQGLLAGSVWLLRSKHHSCIEGSLQTLSILYFDTRVSKTNSPLLQLYQFYYYLGAK